MHVGSISLLRGSTPATVLATIGRLGPRTLLSFDPNIRAGLVRNEAAYRAILAHLLVRADIVKLSDVDLAWLLPGVPADEALQRLSTQGPALVIITQGKHGILARGSMSSVMHIPAFAVPISDTVGAGDTYCAGVLAQLAERGITSRAALTALPEQELRAILRFAAAAAALNCTRVSANPPTLFEVQQFLSQYPQNFQYPQNGS